MKMECGNPFATHDDRPNAASQSVASDLASRRAKLVVTSSCIVGFRAADRIGCKGSDRVPFPRNTRAKWESSHGRHVLSFVAFCAWLRERRRRPLRSPDVCPLKAGCVDQCHRSILNIDIVCKQRSEVSRNLRMGVYDLGDSRPRHWIFGDPTTDDGIVHFRLCPIEIRATGVL